MMPQAEKLFRDLGYAKNEKDDIIVYFKPYDLNDTRVNDITFCKNLKKIILFEGSELGSDAYRLDYDTLYAINVQCYELGWTKGDK